MNYRIALIAALIAVPLLVFLGLGFGRDPHAVPSMLVGKPAPLFELQDLHGETVSLSALRGRPVLINFWATWCYPCQAEHALLQETAVALAGRAHVLGIVYNDAASTVQAYLAQHGGVYPQLIDPNSRVAMDFGIAGVPESFIIDAQGVIVHKQAGVMRPEILHQTLYPLCGDSVPR